MLLSVVAAGASRARGSVALTVSSTGGQKAETDRGMRQRTHQRTKTKLHAVYLIHQLPDAKGRRETYSAGTLHPLLAKTNACLELIRLRAQHQHPPTIREDTIYLPLPHSAPPRLLVCSITQMLIVRGCIHEGVRDIRPRHKAGANATTAGANKGNISDGHKKRKPRKNGKIRSHTPTEYEYLARFCLGFLMR